ncbi:MAG: hypothetical protein JWO44_336 [Bacteroidetes bacterium]|nr:hypothetical protein [Bacteroidota bacterium]
MSDVVEYLRQQSTSDCVAYTEFMLHYKKDEDALYCFFEGFEDRTYYPIRIKNISNAANYYDYVCGGKHAVLKVHSLIKANSYYQNVKTGFFVDKDFDSYSLSSEVYITPTYSIENLYCNKTVLEDIIRSEFKMNSSEKDFENCISMYIELQNRFNQEILFFNAWLACQADYRNENNLSTRLNIDKKIKTIFEKIISPNMSEIKSFSEIQTQADIENIFPDSPSIEKEKLDTKIIYFKTVNHPEIFRGKFQLKFLESFLCRLQSIFGIDCSPFEKKHSCSLRFEYPTLCSSLSQYATTTDCLKSYIKSVS